MDVRQLAEWLLVSAIFVGSALLFVRPPAEQGRIGRRLYRWGAWAVERARPEVEVDPVVEAFFWNQRRERLRADVERLQRIMLTDFTMSATRQLGNRLAYDWLQRELDRARTHPAVVPLETALPTWCVPGAPLQTVLARSSRNAQYAPKVEILDFRWRG